MVVSAGCAYGERIGAIRPDWQGQNVPEMKIVSSRNVYNGLRWLFGG
jgi:hypothetical protein